MSQIAALKLLNKNIQKILHSDVNFAPYFGFIDIKSSLYQNFIIILYNVSWYGHF